VAGFQHRGRPVEPFTMVAGLKARATSAPPFRLPTRWKKAVSSLSDDVAVNFVSTNDIIGGNSGSPLVNANGELIGLVFDGNRYSLGGAYGFDPLLNRTVSVHADFIRTALMKVYKARRLVTELGFKP
ncbi:MAG: S46 family peptidase, partial [Myxococcota bacterium]